MEKRAKRELNPSEQCARTTAENVRRQAVLIGPLLCLRTLVKSGLSVKEAYLRIPPVPRTRKEATNFLTNLMESCGGNGIATHPFCNLEEALRSLNLISEVVRLGFRWPPDGYVWQNGRINDKSPKR